MSNVGLRFDDDFVRIVPYCLGPKVDQYNTVLRLFADAMSGAVDPKPGVKVVCGIVQDREEPDSPTTYPRLVCYVNDTMFYSLTSEGGCHGAGKLLHLHDLHFYTYLASALCLLRDIEDL